jgi:RNA recognition motif-containing protein
MSCRKVFVGSIPGHLTQEEIQLYFRQFVPSAVFKLHRKQKRSSGFGFLQNLTPSQQEVIISVEHSLNGRKLKCHPYLKGDSLQQAQTSLNLRRIFIRGLPKATTEEDIREFFSKFGEIESLYQVKHPVNGKLCPFGFLTYIKEESATKVLEMKSFEFQRTSISCEPFQKYRIAQLESPTTSKQQSGKPSNLEIDPLLVMRDGSDPDQSMPASHQNQLSQGVEGQSDSLDSEDYKLYSSGAFQTHRTRKHRAQDFLDEQIILYPTSYKSEGPNLRTKVSAMAGISVPNKYSKSQQGRVTSRDPKDSIPQTPKPASIDAIFSLGRPDWTRSALSLEHTPENLVFNVRQDISASLVPRMTAFARPL